MSLVSWMLRFLNATEVGGSEGAKERELEWEGENQEEITQKSRRFSQRQNKAEMENRGQKPGYA